MRTHRLRLALLSATALTVALAFADGAPAQACRGADLVPTRAGVTVARQATLCLVNHERTRRGLRPLRGERHLRAAAQAHAQDMSRRRYFAHTARSGASFVDRILRAGYVRRFDGWTLGENIAWGGGRMGSPAAVVDAWMHSPAHRANILNPVFVQVGTGLSTATPVGQAGATYTQDFGRRL